MASGVLHQMRGDTRSSIRINRSHHTKRGSNKSRSLCETVQSWIEPRGKGGRRFEACGLAVSLLSPPSFAARFRAWYPLTFHSCGVRQAFFVLSSPLLLLLLLFPSVLCVRGLPAD